MVPEIRYSDNDWELRKLGDIAPIRGGFAFKSSNFVNSGIPIVKIANILSNGVVSGTFDYYTELANDTNFLLPDKAALLAMSGATTGKVSILSNPNNEKIYQNQRVGYFERLENTDYSFISTLVQSHVFANQLSSILVTGAQPNVSSKDIDSFNICLPSHVDCQFKVGHFFELLNRYIFATEKKVNQLKAFKSAMLEKMFPKEGATVPEIRFEGFTDEWEQRKLNEVVDYSSSYVTVKDIEDDGLYDLYDANGVIGKTNTKCIPEDYISIIRWGSVGRVRILPANTMVISTMGAITTKENDINFIYALLTKANLGVFSRNTSRSTIYFKDYGNKEYAIPSHAEQYKIGAYFDRIDNHITTNQLKLDKLKETKTALLEKMFV